MLPFLIGFCFFLSGMASLAYQSVWMREAMGQFGVITPVLSTVLVVFMGGLAVGTALGARYIRGASGAHALRAYGLVEIGIGVSALTVAPLLRWFADVSAQAMTGADSASFLLISQGFIALSMALPCILIGLTLPLGMRALAAQKSAHGFSHLYLVNLLGAVAGSLLPLLLIELLGFRHSTFVFMGANILAAVAAFLAIQKLAPDSAATALVTPANIPLNAIVLLITTGLITMGAETIWLKAFIPFLGSSVYSFSVVLTCYLLFSYMGTRLYRDWLKNKPEKVEKLYRAALMLLPAAVACSALAISYNIWAHSPALSLLLLAPLCFTGGIILPYLMDEICRHDTSAIYRAYRWNFLGCVLGPLLSTYALFLWVGQQGTLLVYTALAAGVVLWLLRGARQTLRPFILANLVVIAASLTQGDYEQTLSKNAHLIRDHVGSVVARGEGRGSELFVNGVGMTTPSTITKFMAHLPLTHLSYTPKSALTICFGMGTTVRALATWPLENIQAAELSEGVVKSFPHFYGKAEEILNDPRIHIHVDDGRRFLKRTQTTFDIIAIDPPPPIYAAGSGLLYTNEFLTLIKRRLNPQGILQHWLPEGDNQTHAAVYHSLKKHFTYVKMLHSVEGWGVHFLASDHPIPDLSPAEFVKALPAAAQEDLMEWSRGKTPLELAQTTLAPMPEKPWQAEGYAGYEMTDDLPYNEFFWLRRLLEPKE